MAEVDVKNNRIFCRGIHPDVFCKKSALKYLTKYTRETRVQEPFF